MDFIITIDKMALADCFTPLELAKAIHDSNPFIKAPVPLEQIAIAAGIYKIEENPELAGTSIIGALVSYPNKQSGMIFYQPNLIEGRKRFTIGHELGHFLLPLHDENTLDLKNSNVSSDSKFEDEADSFSTELLLPMHLLEPIFETAKPDLYQAIRTADLFKMSVQATINRLLKTNIWKSTLIVFLYEDAKIQYPISSEDELYNAFLYSKGDDCTSKFKSHPNRGESIVQQVPASKWFQGNIDPSGFLLEELYVYHDSDYKILALSLITP